jgi:hypothetical protein
MMVTMPTEPERYDPLPSLIELPSFLLRKLSPQRRRLAWVAGVLLVASLAAAAVLVVPQLRSEDAGRQAELDRRNAAANAELKAKYAREAQPRYGHGPAAGAREAAAALPARRALVAGLQHAVLADARERARRGELNAGYRSATCYGFPKRLDAPAPADDLAHATDVVECIAVARAVAPDARTTTGSLLGQPYRARLDFAQGRYAFCKIVQQPGELSIQRDPVLKVPAACGG